MLAMLMKHGAKPALFVYGGPDDQDVQIARLITEAEGLPLEHIDKSTVPTPDPEAFIGETEKNLFAFDGWKVETPLFDFGEDRRDRAKRHLDGQIPLNGSLGEIYRNFFYIPDRPSSTGAVVSTFYSRYDPKAFTNRFDERRYRSAMKKAMREALVTDSDQLERSQVEELYPKFRGRFWTGRDAQINQRFGPMFFPFLEHAAISNTAKIPIGFKDLGYLQGRMIARINPRLADYPSDYGFALNGPRPLKYRLKTFLGTQRPPALRKLSFRLTHRRMQPRTGPLSSEYLSQVIDIDFPIMRALFNLDAINSAGQFGLIATLEYLGQRYNLRVSDD
jgi:asparagine synthase (glutamine-hydrolysing)